jgi:hypothetical protein
MSLAIAAYSNTFTVSLIIDLEGLMLTTIVSLKAGLKYSARAMVNRDYLNGISIFLSCFDSLMQVMQRPKVSKLLFILVVS